MICPSSSLNHSTFKLLFSLLVPFLCVSVWGPPPSCPTNSIIHDFVLSLPFSYVLHPQGGRVSPPSSDGSILPEFFSPRISQRACWRLPEGCHMLLLPVITSNRDHLRTLEVEKSNRLLATIPEPHLSLWRKSASAEAFLQGRQLAPLSATGEINMRFFLAKLFNLECKLFYDRSGLFVCLFVFKDYSEPNRTLKIAWPRSVRLVGLVKNFSALTTLPFAFKISSKYFPLLTTCNRMKSHYFPQS